MASMRYPYLNQLPADSCIKKACLQCPKGQIFKTDIEKKCYYLEKKLEDIHNTGTNSNENSDMQKHAIHSILGPHTPDVFKREEYTLFNTLASKLKKQWQAQQNI
jgi:hypothetical protein